LSYDEDELEALASTLKVRQRDAIEVRRKVGGRFEIIKGHRRKRAAIRCGMEFLKAVIVELNDKDAAIDLILNNESQEQVGDFERAIAYKNLMAYGLSQADITRELGISSRSTVSQRLRFLDLPQSVQDALREYPRAYSFHTAVKLLAILEANPELVDAVADGTRKVGASDWDVAVLISTLKQKQAKTSSSSNTHKSDLAIVDKQNRPVLTLRPGKKPGIVEIGLGSTIDRTKFLDLLGSVLKKQVEDDGFLPAETSKS
jgi:ParB family chromosome partitioning protein